MNPIPDDLLYAELEHRRPDWGFNNANTDQIEYESEDDDGNR